MTNQKDKHQIKVIETRLNYIAQRCVSLTKEKKYTKNIKIIDQKIMALTDEQIILLEKKDGLLNR